MLLRVAKPSDVSFQLPSLLIPTSLLVSIFRWPLAPSQCILLPLLLLLLLVLDVLAAIAEILLDKVGSGPVVFEMLQIWMLFMRLEAV